MSNLNKAFIQAYKKNHRVADRHVESTAVRPSLSKPVGSTFESSQDAKSVPVAVPEARSKTGVPSPHFFQSTRSVAASASSQVAAFEVPSPALQVEEFHPSDIVAVEEPQVPKMSYRFDTADTTPPLQPWFTAVSTYDLESFVGLTSVKEQDQRKPERTKEVPSPTDLPFTKSSVEIPMPAMTRIDAPIEPAESPITVAKQSTTKPDAKPASSGKVLVTERTSAENYLVNRRPSTTLENPIVERPTPQVEIPSEIAVIESPAVSEQVKAKEIETVEVSEKASIVVEAAPEITRFEQGRVQETFHAIWEVDSFQWPDVSEKLSTAQPSILNEVGRHLRQANSTGLSVLAVTSAAAGQGRTTVACCIARSAAKVGLSVALIDGDLHHPALADELNLEVTHGWLETVSLNLPLEEAAIHSIEDRITLFPLTNRKEIVSIAPDHPKIQAILRKLAKCFDLVVIDSQHLSHPSYRLMGCGVNTPIDAAVLVVDKNFANNDETNESIRRLSRIGVESVGLVENFQ